MASRYAFQAIKLKRCEACSGQLIAILKVQVSDTPGDAMKNKCWSPKKLKAMTINDAQQKVDDWIKTFGVRYFSELTNLGILMEEVGELSRLMVRTYGEQSFKEPDNNLQLADEMADVLWVLICLANQTGVNLTDALQKNFEKKNLRDAMRHKNNEKLK